MQAEKEKFHELVISPFKKYSIINEVSTCKWQ